MKTDINNENVPKGRLYKRKARVREQVRYVFS